MSVITSDMRDDCVERAVHEFARGHGLNGYERMLCNECTKHVLEALDRLDVGAMRAEEQTAAMLRDRGFG